MNHSILMKDGESLLKIRIFFNSILQTSKRRFHNKYPIYKTEKKKEEKRNFYEINKRDS